MYQFVEVLDPDGSLTDALEDLIDCGALVEIDLADLPSHRIEAAVRAWAKLEGTRWGSITPAGRAGMVEVAESMIRAFLETDDKED